MLLRRCAGTAGSRLVHSKASPPLGFKGLGSLDGLDDDEARVIINRENEREHQRLQFRNNPRTEFSIIRKSVAENVDNDISRITKDDYKSPGAVNNARKYLVDPGSLAGIVQVPSSPATHSRPLLGETGLDPEQLPKRVTEDDLRTANLTEQDFSSSLIHGRAIHPPIYHPQTHAIPAASILFRSHDTTRLELFTHFTSHAAAALGIPISRTIKIPKRRRLWTVIKGPFIDKKSQENFERVIHSRMIKAWDANPEVIDRWIAYLETHMLGGIGMRVTKWEHVPFSIGALRSTYVKNELGKPEPAHAPQIRDFAEHAQQTDLLSTNVLLGDLISEQTSQVQRRPGQAQKLALEDDPLLVRDPITPTTTTATRDAEWKDWRDWAVDPTAPPVHREPTVPQPWEGLGLIDMDEAGLAEGLTMNAEERKRDEDDERPIFDEDEYDEDEDEYDEDEEEYDEDEDEYDEDEDEGDEDEDEDEGNEYEGPR